MFIVTNEGLKYIDDETQQHYGVKGMKWGVHRARRKMEKNEKLRKKALEADGAAAALSKKSEKIHATRDLGRSNKYAATAASRLKKAAKLEKKALKTDDDFKRAKLESKAAKAKYRAAADQVHANRISKTTGYGVRAMKYSVKSDKAARKAAKIRMKVANNERYIAAMKRKASSIPDEELRTTYAFVNELFKD